MKVKNEKAYNSVIKARTVLIVTQPFFGALALHLNIRENENIPTMDVDGFVIRYNPEFVLAMSEEQVTGVMAHEVMHCVYKHMTRRGSRHPVIYNYAGDYRINWDIVEAGFKLPGKPGEWESKPKVSKTRPAPATPSDKPKKINVDEFRYCYDKQFKDMSTEEIYEKIKQDVEKALKKAGFNQDEIDRVLNGEDPGGCGGVRDAGGEEGAAAGDAAEQEWDQLTRMCVAIAKRANAGKLPGYLERIANYLEEPKVNWRDLTRQFIDGNMIKDFSWQRPNRRFVGRGLHLPGFIPDSMHKLVMVLDVSGSITQEMMVTFASECAGALDEGIADSIVTVYVDTDLRGSDEFYQGDKVEIRTIAGGGTNFSTFTPWLKVNHPDATCIVWLTDMQTNSFGEDPDVPTLWGAYAPSSVIDHYKPPYGQVIQINSD